MAKRHIAFVLPVYWPAVGGCELATHELAQHLAQRHDVRVIALIDSEEDKHAHELWVGAILRAPRKDLVTWDGSIPVTRPGMGVTQRYFYAFLARVQSPKLPGVVVRAAMEQLADHYRQRLEPLLNGTDIVHSVHGGASFIGYAALLAARRMRIPFVYTPLMHLLGGPASAAAHRDEIEPSARLIPRTWTDHYWRRIWLQADAVLTMTDYERSYYIREGVPAHRVHRTGVGPLLPHPAPNPPTRLDVPDADPTVLFLARNTLAKGVGLLLEAAPLVWAAFPRTRFVIAGPPAPESDGLLARAADPRLLVLGTVTEAEKDDLMRRCSIYCMPSREESLGATYLEAWSHGKPIIGLRIPPLQELNDSDRGGLLSEPTAKDIADKLCWLLGHPDTMREMGAWGRERTLSRYSWTSIASRTETIYEGLLQPAQEAEKKAAMAEVP